MGLKQFTVYENASVSSLTDLGTVGEQMTEKGWIEPIDSNFKREYKMVEENGVMVEKYNRVMVLIFNGEIDPISKKKVNVSYVCSEPLSRELRQDPTKFYELANNHIFESDNGNTFIGKLGEENIKIGYSEMKTKTVKATRTGLERLIAL
jgi:YHS domain-containing protein